MNLDKIVADEQALTCIANTVKQCITDLTERFDVAIKEAEQLSENWNDDDFTDFYTALTAFRTDLDALDGNAARIMQTVYDKIEMIHTLHNLKL